jgi:hypothetical protein
MEILKNIPVRPYTEADHPKIMELIRTVHNQRVYEKAIQRFKWQFEQNPNNTSQDPLVLVLEKEDKIIGMIAATAQKLKIGDKIYKAYWLGDFMVHPDFRSACNGIKIARAIAAQPYLLMGFPANHTKNIWFRVGFKKFIHLTEYSRTKRRFNILGWNFDRWLDPLPYKIPQEIKIIDVKSFDEKFDRFWEKISKDYRAVQVRDSRFLNWRFFKCPYLTYRVLAAIKENEMLGYIVIRDEHANGTHEGVIVDILTDRSNNVAMTALIRAGVLALKDAGCTVIKTVVPPEDKVLNDTLSQNSFYVSVKEIQGVFFNRSGDAINSIIQWPSNWLLTKTDSDVDYS